MQRSSLWIYLAVLALGAVTDTTWAQPGPSEAARLAAALDAQAGWLATSPQGAGWTAYLETTKLREQIASASPDRSVVVKVLERYQSGKPGLESPIFARVRTSLAQWIDQLPIAPAELANLARAAKGEFVAVKPGDEAATLAQAKQSLADLQTYLATQGANGANWARFLKIDELKTQLQADPPNLEQLAKTSAPLESGHAGLQLAPFDQLRVAVENYLRTAREAKNAEAANQFAADVDRLATLLEPYAAQPASEAGIEIGSILGRLRATGQAPKLITAVRGQFARPNVYLQVSDDFLGHGFAERVDETDAVRESIEGTRIRGTAHTVGNVTVTLVPDDEKAVLQALFRGTTETKTVGTNGPARIYSTGTTQLTGNQRLYVDADGFHALPSTSEAQTSLRTNGIGTTSGGIRGCIVERVATKRVAEAKPGAERTTSRKAEERLNVRLAERVNKLMAQANDRYWNQIRQPLVEKKQFPEEFWIRTTANELLVTGVFAAPDRLAAAAAPPAIANPADVAIRLHESAVNNFAQGVLAGQTLHSEEARKELTEILGETPEQFKDEEGKAPWSITFADDKPVEVAFGDGQFTITIRGKGYTADDRSYRAMNVTAVYKIESSEKGLKAVRQGDLQIFPPGFVPGQRRFSVPEQTLRSILERRFGKLFTPEIGGELLQPIGRFKNIGPLEMNNFASSAGWITVGFVPAPASANVVAQQQ